MGKHNFTHCNKTMVFGVVLCVCFVCSLLLSCTRCHCKSESESEYLLSLGLRSLLLCLCVCVTSLRGNLSYGAQQETE